MKDEIFIKRQWGDHRIASVDFDNLEGLQWGRIAGGTNRMMPKPLIQAYVRCDLIKGEIAHSCLHEGYPHRIKVCIVKGDNNPRIQKKLTECLGRQPN